MDGAKIAFDSATLEDEDCAPTEGCELLGLEELVLLFERGRVVVVSSGRFKTLVDLEAEMVLGLGSSESPVTLLDSACEGRVLGLVALDEGGSRVGEWGCQEWDERDRMEWDDDEPGPLVLVSC